MRGWFKDTGFCSQGMKIAQMEKAGIRAAQHPADGFVVPESPEFKKRMSKV